MKPSYSLNREDAAVIKLRLSHDEKQHDIAADYGVNQGRISEIKTGKKFADVLPALYLPDEKKPSKLTSEEEEIVLGILKKLEEGDRLRGFGS